MACYFASDVHLGLSYRGDDPRQREERFVAWLDAIEPDCDALFLVGDIFDFWFEYRRVVPKGFVRTFGKLAAMCDRGIPVHFFPGNHDLWVGDYFSREIGMQIHYGPQEIAVCGARLFVAHGDGLGNTTRSYRFLRGLFHSRFARRAFSALVHPNLALRFGQWWSSGSRHGRHVVAHVFRGDAEPITRFAREYAETHPVDYCVCGHLHTPVIHRLNDRSSLVILGEWIEQPVAGRLENGRFELITL